MAAVSVSVAGLVSSVHHGYGAIVYDTPWRLLVSLWIPVFVLLALLMLYLYWKHADNVFFELTGLLQLAGFWAAWRAYRVFRERPVEP